MTGPIDDFPWPPTLTARVADATPEEPRIHGYGVESDLALHYGLAGQLLVTLTGSLPDRPTERGLEAALQFAAVTSVAEAPAHAALVASLTAAAPAAVIATGATVAAEQARHDVEAHAPVLGWLGAEHRGALPDEHRATDEAERASVRRLRQAVGEPLAAHPIFDADPSRIAAVLGCLHAAGLTERRALTAALTWARLPLVCSEAFAQPALAFRDYPMNLPELEYEARERPEEPGEGGPR
ncbi:MAG: hypothetical protein ACFCGT_18130 [Sandaracinaceae bacterium]